MFIIVGLMFMLHGCVTKDIPIQNKISDTSNLDLEYLKKNYVLVEKGCSNKKQRWMMLFIPISGLYSFTDEYVLDELLNECDGDIAANVEINDFFIYTGYINYYGVTTKGDIWRKK